MAVFTITTFSTFVGVLLAARKLAADPDILDRAKALADLAGNVQALTAALRDSGLTPLAQEMTRQAEELAIHFTHPGPARDDAIALFWQVAPDAFADPAALVGADLDPDLATERMVAAIKASPRARDFTTTVLAEPFFRAVARESLTVLSARADFIASIAPDLWRETLRRHGVQLELLRAVKQDTAEILALVRELHRTRDTTVPEATLIAMARKISPRVADRDEALRALDAAADLAAEAQASGEAGSNVDAFVDATLRRLADLTAEGRLDAAAAAADSAIEAAEAGLAQLLDAAVRQHLLAFDAEGASRLIVRRLALEHPDPDALFGALRTEQGIWYERGRDRGLRIDLEVAIALARHGQVWARNPDQRGAVLNNLGNALLVLGDWESGTARLEEAVTAYGAALSERTRGRVPLDWAATQDNLGVALQKLGEREAGTARLEEAVAAYRAALQERTEDRVPLEWAGTQNNLGTALARLGERETGMVRLEEAVAAYREALGERTRERVPLDWAMTQNNLGGALAMLGERESGTARLKEAVVAYRAALEERTRERVPLDWAATQYNLGGALLVLGGRESGTALLEEAVAAYGAALEERTRERVPLRWAMTTGNQGAALCMLAQRTSDLGMARRARDQIAEAVAALREAGHAPYADYYAGELPAAEALVAKLAR